MNNDRSNGKSGTSGRGWFGILLLAAGSAIGCGGDRTATEDPAKGKEPAAENRATGQEPAAAGGTTSMAGTVIGNSEAIRKGDDLFHRFNCQQCHVADSPFGAPMIDDGEWKYGGDPESLHISIAQGRPLGMPPYAGKMTDEEIWQVVAYLVDLND